MIILFLFLLAPIFHASAMELCQNTLNESNLEIIEITDITNNQNKWSWLAEEEVEISVKVENKNYSQRNFKIELFFYDENEELKENFIKTGNLTKIINLDKQETNTTNFTLEINDIPSGNYSLYTKLTDENNETICTSLKAETKNNEININLIKEESLVVIRNITGPTTTSPGSYVEYTVELINLGNKKEDKVLAIIYNSNLNLREEKEILNLDIEKNKTVKFNFTIPKNARITNETILFSTEFDYDNKIGHYQKEAIKDKIFTLEIIPSLLNKTSIELNQTELNQTELNQTENNSNSSLPDLPYLWIIITII